MSTRKSLQEHGIDLVVHNCIFVHTKPWELQDFDPRTSEHLDQLEPGAYRVHPEVYHMLLGPEQSNPANATLPIRAGVVLMCDENVPKGLAVSTSTRPQTLGRKN